MLKFYLVQKLMYYLCVLPSRQVSQTQYNCYC
ncbi:Uncharacterised protein [Vibrio cholerae]|nr:Uncharacterised protein [Vibrio cholerae]